ncbi:F-box/kelch-repeat protein SKIP11 [Camellia lanceoleosa]|uniref:F-box/kelch-repeat protein SKIP11 n=1 Tax=Camellia lanceoleosa TaxID=1840588 RepID=A0ACC0I159_9ERIC|nr:F-box/kelch-repeat protein SKIP11 [Camellia lanceoleosa]
MFFEHNSDAVAIEAPATTNAPPMLAVVKLYAAYYAENEVGKYNKERKMWLKVGRLPEQAVSMNGWGLVFRACGDRLIVIGGPRALSGGIIEVNAWNLDEGPP